VVHLGQDAVGGVAVQLPERPLPQDLPTPEELEQVEPEIAEVGLVVVHAAAPRG
jgi:hypothetical protein